MKILITGICGFVGSEIALQLRENLSVADLQIIGIDNLSRNGSWRNRERLDTQEIAVVHGDIRLATDLDAVGAVDWVIDAAANPSVLAGVDGKSSSRQLIDYNLLGTVNLLEYCKQHKAGFVLLSTSRVYSIPPLAGLQVEPTDRAFIPVGNNLPAGIAGSGISEGFSTTAPVSLYGATKLASEQLALEFGYTFDFPVWINRCGVMAGAGQFGKADQGIFAFWLHSWKEQRPLRYIGFGGHGHQVRDCLHPRDLVPLLLKQCAAGNGDRPAVVNVSGGVGSATSLAQLSNWCAERWGHRDVGVDTTPRPFDLPWVVLDNSLASEVWGWKPAISARQILMDIATFADSQSDWIAFSK
ncbi:MAG: NAD-dependent epimerase/dehydratase family protein [Fuerstiella sp.]|nr:NAD-dependent epimerase/dehydratase family protein [Fuerstiella sp.]MCP4787483.1 NAD-dependent epimerase/dehydratase family protein [Fuerstiella sp.]MCP4859010.1 NAD-dependent epimerase/dehydratase family protein [Fuerstiella sp.]